MLGRTDAFRLSELAARIEAAQPQLAALLWQEIERAKVCEDDELPDTIVAMNSHVAFVDRAHGMKRSVELVYPEDADIGANRVSVLTPVGAGLIGLSPGQSISWPDREGRLRAIEILEVRRGSA